jgi:hypothetical protein
MKRGRGEVKDMRDLELMRAAGLGTEPDAIRPARQSETREASVGVS